MPRNVLNALIISTYHLESRNAILLPMENEQTHYCLNRASVRKIIDYIKRNKFYTINGWINQPDTMESISLEEWKW